MTRAITNLSEPWRARPQHVRKGSLTTRCHSVALVELVLTNVAARYQKEEKKNLEVHCGYTTFIFIVCPFFSEEENKSLWLVP